MSHAAESRIVPDDRIDMRPGAIPVRSYMRNGHYHPLRVTTKYCLGFVRPGLTEAQVIGCDKRAQSASCILHALCLRLWIRGLFGLWCLSMHVLTGLAHPKANETTWLRYPTQPQCQQRQLTALDLRQLSLLVDVPPFAILLYSQSEEGLTLGLGLCNQRCHCE
jgi:hypothetical protein